MADWQRALRPLEEEKVEGWQNSSERTTGPGELTVLSEGVSA
jgi:hypothetical protein